MDTDDDPERITDLLGEPGSDPELKRYPPYEDQEFTENSTQENAARVESEQKNINPSSLPVITSVTKKSERKEEHDPFEYGSEILPNGQKLHILLNIKGHTNISDLQDALTEHEITGTLGFIEGVDSDTEDAKTVVRSMEPDSHIYDIFAIDPLSDEAFREFAKVLGTLGFCTKPELLWKNTLPKILEKYFEKVPVSDMPDIRSKDTSLVVQNERYKLKADLKEEFLDNVAWMSIPITEVVARFVNAWLVYSQFMPEVSMAELNRRLAKALDKYDASSIFQSGKGNYLNLAEPLLKRIDKMAKEGKVTRAELGYYDFKLIMSIINQRAAQKIIQIMGKNELKDIDEVVFYAGGEHSDAIEEVIQRIKAGDQLTSKG